MEIRFVDNSWADYLFWQSRDKKILKKINDLVKTIDRTPYEGIGNPEQLKHDLSGFWSRRINKEHRLVYKVENDEIVIYNCRFHYDKSK